MSLAKLTFKCVLVLHGDTLDVNSSHIGGLIERTKLVPDFFSEILAFRYFEQGSLAVDALVK